MDPDLDLAALRLTYTHPVPYLSLAKEPPEDGMSAVTIGYPRLPDVLQTGLTIHPTVFPVTVSGEAIGQSRIAHKASAISSHYGAHECRKQRRSARRSRVRVYPRADGAYRSVSGNSQKYAGRVDRTGHVTSRLELLHSLIEDPRMA